MIIIDSGVEVKLNEKVKLLDRDHKYKPSTVNPIMKSKYECIGRITSISTTSSFESQTVNTNRGFVVYWENGKSNIYFEGDLVKYRDTLDSINSIW
jgi:hypothetical protein